MPDARVAANYAAWATCAGDFPAHGSRRDKLRFFAGFGVLAPSVHNSQPWRISVSETGIGIAPNLSHALPIADPDGMYMRMAMGMCAENIVIAAGWFGFAGPLRVDDDGTVHIDLTEGAQTQKNISPDDIVARVSDKRPYLDRAAPPAILDAVANAAAAPGITSHFVTETAGKRAIVDAHRRAIDITASNDAFVRELASMLRANTTSDMRGMPGFVADIPTLPSIIMPPMFKLSPSMFRKLASNDADRVVAHSAGFGTILSDDHTCDADVRIGRTYQQTALLLRRAGLVDAMMTAALSHTDIRQDLERALGLRRQMRLLFRIGYAPAGGRRHTPRAPLSSTC